MELLDRPSVVDEPVGQEELSMKGKKHAPERIIKKLREAGTG